MARKRDKAEEIIGLLRGAAGCYGRQKRLWREVELGGLFATV